MAPKHDRIVATALLLLLIGAVLAVAAIGGAKSQAFWDQQETRTAQ